MGIIDDYYGGYENLAMHTGPDGTDFDAAYGSACGFDSQVNAATGGKVNVSWPQARTMLHSEQMMYVLLDAASPEPLPLPIFL